MRGFTLLELVVVLLILGLLAALAAPTISGTLESGRLRSGAAEMRAVFTLARTLAVSGGKERAVIVDRARGLYGVDGEEERRLPEGVEVSSARVGDRAEEGDTFRVQFYPDGSAEETEVVLAASGAGGLRVAVDPLTGIAEAVR